ncbi:ABC transporter permease [Georgenia yuyongxinii]|uniref:ABC transporter permease n=1 Tax=Georgenia yuyongxinii TaxID=2589797 RepID=A0A5B8C1H5_9MICO|nr:ABC transporter permease subunit [Georgenia yuyongxinii]QDC23947.1 ABC transporter permease [Georgenia yuyongxinii]
MSTVTATPSVTRERPAHSPVRARLSFPGVMRGEWIKLLSLRSTWWTLGITVVLMTLVSLGQAASIQFMMEEPEGAAFVGGMHGAEVATAGYQFGMVTIAVLGALLITGEYSTGMIRSTLAAVPTRLPVLAAKAIALVVLTLVVTAVGLALSYLVTMPFLSDFDLVPALDDTQTWQVVGGIAYFLIAAGLFALAMGTLLRSTAGAVTVSLTVLLLLPGILQFITLDWVQDIVTYLPLPAAMAFTTVSEAFSGEGGLSPWTGFAVVTAWAVVPMIAAAVTLRRRDA